MLFISWASWKLRINSQRFWLWVTLLVKPAAFPATMWFEVWTAVYKVSGWSIGVSHKFEEVGGQSKIFFYQHLHWASCQFVLGFDRGAYTSLVASHIYTTSRSEFKIICNVRFLLPNLIQKTNTPFVIVAVCTPTDPVRNNRYTTCCCCCCSMIGLSASLCSDLWRRLLVVVEDCEIGQTCSGWFSQRTVARLRVDNAGYTRAGLPATQCIEL